MDTERMLTRGQLQAIDTLIDDLGLPADGTGMCEAQRRLGASEQPYGYRLMTREQADLLLSLLRNYQYVRSHHAGMQA